MSAIANVTIAFQKQLVNRAISVGLLDGTSVVFRPMQTEDVRLLLEMHNRLSADSVYYRYLHPYKPTFEELDCLHRLNGEDGAAFVGAIEGPRKKVIALACYRIDPQNPTIAEPAVLIEDQFQGQGLGRVLMRRLGQHAVMNGIQAFDALIDPANRRVMRLIEQSGLPFEAKLIDGSYEVRIWLNALRRSGHDVFKI